MTRNTKRTDYTKVTMNMPNTLLEEVDLICTTNFMARTQWLVQAAKEKIERERIEKIKKLKESMKE